MSARWNISTFIMPLFALWMQITRWCARCAVYTLVKACTPSRIQHHDLNYCDCWYRKKCCALLKSKQAAIALKYELAHTGPGTRSAQYYICSDGVQWDSFCRMGCQLNRRTCFTCCAVQNVKLSTTLCWVYEKKEKSCVSYQIQRGEINIVQIVFGESLDL